MTDVLGPATKNRIADMVVRTDKTREHDFVRGAYDTVGVRILLGQLDGRSDGFDPVIDDEHGGILEDPCLRVDRDNGGMLYQYGHCFTPSGLRQLLERSSSEKPSVLVCQAHRLGKPDNIRAHPSGRRRHTPALRKSTRLR